MPATDRRIRRSRVDPRLWTGPRTPLVTLPQKLTQSRAAAPGLGERDRERIATELIHDFEGPCRPVLAAGSVAPHHVACTCQGVLMGGPDVGQVHAFGVAELAGRGPDVKQVERDGSLLLLGIVHESPGMRRGAPLGKVCIPACYRCASEAKLPEGLADMRSSIPIAQAALNRSRRVQNSRRSRGNGGRRARGNG